MRYDRSLKKNALLNVIKQGCLICVPIIMFTYSSHILGANNIGIYTFSQSIVSYFALIAGLGVSTYAIREGAGLRESAQKIEQFSNEIYTINVLATLVAYSILFSFLIFSSKLANYRTNILIQAVSIALTTVGADWVFQIYEDYYYLTVRDIIIQALLLVSVFVFIKTKNDLLPYTIITMLSTCGGNLVNLFFRKKYVKVHLTKKIYFRKHLTPIVVLFSNTIAVQIYVQSDITLLGVFSNDRIVGVYSVCVKLYSLVKQILNAITTVTVPRFAYLLSQKDSKKYNKMGNKVIDVLLIFIFPSVVGMMFEGKNIIYLFAGEEYLMGVHALQLLCIALFFAVGGCFFASSILIPNKQEKYFLLATVIAALINLGLNFVFIPLWGMEGAALTTIIAECTNFIICFRRARRFFTLKKNYRSYLSIVIGCSLIAMICNYCNRFFSNRYLQLFVSIVLSATIYGFIQIILNRKVVKGLVTK